MGAVIFRGEAVLLVRRGQEPARDSWSLPGGLVELGESLTAAIHREIAEETGLTVRILGVSAVLERIFPDEAGQIAYHYVLIDYLGEYLAGALQPGSDITAARFVARARPARLRAAAVHPGRSSAGPGNSGARGAFCRCCRGGLNKPLLKFPFDGKLLENPGKRRCRPGINGP